MMYINRELEKSKLKSLEWWISSLFLNFETNRPNLVKFDQSELRI